MAYASTVDRPNPLSRPRRVPVVGLYLRISDLTDTSTSIERQEIRGRDRAEQMGGRIHDVYVDEDKSAWKAGVKRDGWDRVRADLRNRVIDTLIVWKLDRATRAGIVEAVEIIHLVEELGCRFVSIMDGIDSVNEGWDLQLVISAKQARQESTNTSVRVKDLNLLERDSGVWNFARPYGFVITPTRTLARHPIEAGRVVEIVRRLKTGEAPRQVAKWANAQGWDCPSWAKRKERIAELERKGDQLKADALRVKPLKSPNSWSGSSISQLVCSPIMIGHVSHQGDSWRHSQTGEIVSSGERILSNADYAIMRLRFGATIEAWRKRAAAAASPLVSSMTRRAVSSLLLDFLHCGDCGARMAHVSMTRTRRDGSRHPYRRYVCIRSREGGKCGSVTIGAEWVEAQVADMLLARLGAASHDDPAVLAIAERWNDQRTPDRAARRAELDMLIADEEHALTALEDQALDGLFPGERGKRRLAERVNAANARLDRYEAERRGLDGGGVLDVGFVEEIGLVAQGWADWDLAERRGLLGVTVERVWVSKAPGKGVHPTPDRLTTWFVGDERPNMAPEDTFALAA